MFDADVSNNTRSLSVSASGPVEVVDYDAAWEQRFVDYQARIHEALGGVAVRVEHIGSTAVPGLAAKPVIDVQVSVPEVAALDQYKPGLESLGFLHRPHSEDEEAREFFRPRGPRVVHVHVVQAGGVEERRYLLHRDFLRAHSTVASEYGALKKRLAGELKDVRQDYQWRKSPFLEEMQLKAEEWAATTSWLSTATGSGEER
ncbi:MAG: GrpB family protein [Acidimicrobiales bacterium]